MDEIEEQEQAIALRSIIFIAGVCIFSLGIGVFVLTEGSPIFHTFGGLFFWVGLVTSVAASEQFGAATGYYCSSCARNTYRTHILERTIPTTCAYCKRGPSDYHDAK